MFIDCDPVRFLGINGLITVKFQFHATKIILKWWCDWRLQHNFTSCLHTGMCSHFDISIAFDIEILGSPLRFTSDPRLLWMCALKRERTNQTPTGQLIRYRTNCIVFSPFYLFSSSIPCTVEILASWNCWQLRHLRVLQRNIGSVSSFSHRSFGISSAFMLFPSIQAIVSITSIGIHRLRETLAYPIDSEMCVCRALSKSKISTSHFWKSFFILCNHVIDMRYVIKITKRRINLAPIRRE